MNAIKNGKLLVRVERDTKWARDRYTYADPPRGYTVLSDRAKMELREGRERCGYGAMHGECEPVRASRGVDYARGTLVPTFTGQWSNYGAPSGTHTTVDVAWAFQLDPQTVGA